MLFLIAPSIRGRLGYRTRLGWSWIIFCNLISGVVAWHQHGAGDNDKPSRNAEEDQFHL